MRNMNFCTGQVGTVRVFSGRIILLQSPSLPDWMCRFFFRDKLNWLGFQILFIPLSACDIGVYTEKNGQHAKKHFHLHSILTSPKAKLETGRRVKIKVTYPFYVRSSCRYLEIYLQSNKSNFGNKNVSFRALLYSPNPCQSLRTSSSGARAKSSR